MINSFNFLKRAALSTDYESIRNNAAWHPRAWFSKAQNYINNDLFKANENDSIFKSLGKGAGRFLIGDVLTGTAKNIMGIADAPVRLGLSGIDTLKGDITGKEFVGRLADTGNDALWAALTFATGGSARGVATAGTRLAKGLIPGTSANFMKRNLAKTSDDFLKRWNVAATKGDKEALNKLFTERANYIQNLGQKLKLNQGQIDHYKADLFEKLNIKPANMSRHNADVYKKQLFQDFAKQQNLYNTSNKEALYDTIKRTQLGFKDTRDLYRMSGVSAPERIAGNIRTAVMHNPWVNIPMWASMIPMSGELTGLMDTKSGVGKVLNFPMEFAYNTIGGMGTLANKWMTHVPREYVDETLTNLGLPKSLKSVLFMPAKGGQYTLNTNAVAHLAKTIAEANNIPEKEAYTMLYSNLMPRNAVAAAPFLGFERASQQFTNDARNNAVANAARAQFFESFNS